jgi:hypothetical protein
MVWHLTRDADGDTGYGLYAGTTKTRHAGDYAYMYIADFTTQRVQMVRSEDITAVIAETTFDEFSENPFRLSSDLLLEA